MDSIEIHLKSSLFTQYLSVHLITFSHNQCVQENLTHLFCDNGTGKQNKLLKKCTTNFAIKLKLAQLLWVYNALRYNLKEINQLKKNIINLFSKSQLRKNTEKKLNNKKKKGWRNKYNQPIPVK